MKDKLRELENFTGELLKKVKQPIRHISENEGPYNAGAGSALHTSEAPSTHK